MCGVGVDGWARRGGKGGPVEVAPTLQMHVVRDVGAGVGGIGHGRVLGVVVSGGGGGGGGMD